MASTAGWWPILYPQRAPVEQVRNSAHRLGAAGQDDVGIPVADLAVRQIDGLQAASARHVDRVSGDFLGHSRPIRDLAADVRAASGLTRTTEQRFLDLRRRHRGAAQGLRGGGRSELGGREARQGAAELPDWGSDGPGNDNVSHQGLPSPYIERGLCEAGMIAHSSPPDPDPGPSPSPQPESGAPSMDGNLEAIAASQ